MSALSISVILVSWRDTDSTVRAVTRIAEVSDAALDVVVVVNEADAQASDRISEARPGTTVAPNDENRGFGPACNQGASAATGDILLFLNPDTHAEPGLADGVVAAFEANPGAIAVAPRLMDTGGGDTRQRPFQLRRLPSLLSDTRELLLIDQLWPGNPGRRRDRYLDRDRAEPFEVEQAAAAALAVRREAFEAVGGFDERFVPAYWEDVDLCLRLRDQGTIVFWPDVRLQHDGGIAADLLGRRRFLRMYYRNALRYRARHYSRPSQAVYRVLLAMGMSFRAFFTSAVSLRKPGARGAIAGYLDVAAMAIRGDRNTE